MQNPTAHGTNVLFELRSCVPEGSINMSTGENKNCRLNPELDDLKSPKSTVYEKSISQLVLRPMAKFVEIGCLMVGIT